MQHRSLPIVAALVPEMALPAIAYRSAQDPKSPYRLAGDLPGLIAHAPLAVGQADVPCVSAHNAGYASQCAALEATATAAVLGLAVAGGVALILMSHPDWQAQGEAVARFIVDQTEHLVRKVHLEEVTDALSNRFCSEAPDLIGPGHAPVTGRLIAVMCHEASGGDADDVLGENVVAGPGFGQKRPSRPNGEPADDNAPADPEGAVVDLIGAAGTAETACDPGTQTIEPVLGAECPVVLQDSTLTASGVKFIPTVTPLPKSHNLTIMSTATVPVVLAGPGAFAAQIPQSMNALVPLSITAQVGSPGPVSCTTSTGTDPACLSIIASP